MVETGPGLVVVVERAVWLLDPADGTRRATWTPLDDAVVQLLGGDDDVVWIREPDHLVALDTEALVEQHRIPVAGLVRATYGYGRGWYVTVDADALTGTIEGIDAASGAPVAVFDYQTETREGRGGTYVVTPAVWPDPVGVLFRDERTSGTYRLTVDG
ncbi:MAG: hypothetical protein OES57_04375 [Acidimicrobiia bacterium]|nr:hypothetical protein [Acidimicrobiia bacterium]